MRRHLATYVAGLLAPIPHKSARVIAQAFGVPVRTLELFLEQLRWEPEPLRNRLQQIVAGGPVGPDPVAVLADAAVPKRRGWYPAAGWIRDPTGRPRERGISLVHLGYAVCDRAGFLDGDLYVPETPARSRIEGAVRGDLPPPRPKWEIALEQLDAARRNGLVPGWVACGEAFLESRRFLEELAVRGQRLVGILPSDLRCWVVVGKGSDGRDDMTFEGFHALAKSLPLRAYCWSRSLREQLEQHPALRFQPWRTCRVDDDKETPLDWSVRRTTCMLLAKSHWVGPLELVAYRPAGARYGASFVVTNDRSATSETIVEAAERARHAAWELDESWTRIGAGHFSGRTYTGLRRHLTLASLASWFGPGSPRGVGTGEPSSPARWHPTSCGKPSPDSPS